MARHEEVILKAELVYKKEDQWTNYPKGVIWAFEKEGLYIEEGMDILFYGNIPNGLGLSSSGSLEVLMGYILKDLFRIDVKNIRLALLGRLAENEYVGVNSGIMDQFASAMGKEEHAIFLDTADLSYEYIPICLENVKIVIANTNKKRGLADSKYNERSSFKARRCYRI